MTVTTGIAMPSQGFRRFTPPDPPTVPDDAGASAANVTDSSSGNRDVRVQVSHDALQYVQQVAIRILLGTAGNDQFTIGSNTAVAAGDGDDTVDVGENGLVAGGDGSDTVHAWSDSIVDGGDGNDSIDVWSGGNVTGGAGNDTIRAWSNSSIDGGDGDDQIDAWADSRVDGGAGDDNIIAWSNSDISGGDGNDVIQAGTGSRIDGGAGNDVIRSFNGSFITGGKGDDTLLLGVNDTVQFNVGDGKDFILPWKNMTLQFGNGISASGMHVTYSGFADYSARAIITFDGNDTDQITIELATDPVTVVFADGTHQEIKPMARAEALAAGIDMEDGPSQVAAAYAEY